MQVSRTAAEARLADVVKSAKDVLYRRKWTMAAVAGVVMVAGVAGTFSLTPKYQGVTQIQIDPQRDPLSRSRNDAQAQLATEAIETQVSVMTSLDLARAVVARLDLLNDPQFVQDLQKIHSDHPLSKDEKIEIIAKSLEDHLTVARNKLTYIIDVKYASKDAKQAARIVNEFAAAYIDASVNNNIGTAQKQTAFFQKQLDQMAADARAADEKVAQFEANAGIVSKSDVVGTITDQQIGPLSVQMAAAQGLAAEARAKASSARQLVAQGKLDTVSDVRNSATIVSLKQSRAVLVQNLADMRLRYGDAYPDLIKVRDQITEIDRQITMEAKRVVSSLDSDAAASEAQADSLRSNMQHLENQKADETHASVMLQSLQRDADSKHAAYDRMAQTTMDTRQATQAAFAQAQILDVARVPAVPYFPNKPLMIALSFLLGVGAGLAVIIIQEMLVSGMSSVQAIEDELGQKLIAAIPRVPNTTRPADIILQKQTSQFSEALRNALATIKGVKSDVAIKIIAMSSALPNEGKTTTSLGLARTSALSGSRTIIVDVDVRRAQLASLLDVTPTGPGTVELLRREAKLDDAIIPTGLDKLDTILVRKPHFTSENLFGNETIHDLLEQLSERYDTIVLDLPPLVGLADGRFLAALADVVVLAVKWNATPLAAAKSAVNWLASDGANLAGVMYTMVDPMSQAYGSYYYYSAQYASYYQES